MDSIAPASADLVVTASTAARSGRVGGQSDAGSPLVPPFRGLNGNSRPARRYREIATAIADDCGGPDKLSEPTKILVRQAASLTLQIEGLQTKLVAGEDVDSEQLVRLSNVLGRTLHRLGLRKAAPKPAPSLLARLAGAAR
jgi:hypothetical protein